MGPNVKALLEAMTHYNDRRNAWIGQFLTDEGFDEWFSAEFEKTDRRHIPKTLPPRRH